MNDFPPPDPRPRHVRSLGAMVLLLALMAACTSEAVAQSTREEAPVQSETDTPMQLPTDNDLVIIETPQDRGVLDGPVIWGPPTDEDTTTDLRGEREIQEDPEDRPEGPDDANDPIEVAPVERGCDFEYLGNNLSSNRGNALPHGRLQVVVFYDGDPTSSPQLSIQLTNDTDIVIGGQRAGGPIETFGRTIETREYQLYDCEPTGDFLVTNAVPNGVIDGVAFGLMWRNNNGEYTMLKSTPTEPTNGATYVGMWPLGFSRDSFTERTPEITDGFGRETARGLIIGAALVGNGRHELPVPSLAG